MEALSQCNPSFRKSQEKKGLFHQIYVLFVGWNRNRLNILSCYVIGLRVCGLGCKFNVYLIEEIYPLCTNGLIRNYQTLPVIQITKSLLIFIYVVPFGQFGREGTRLCLRGKILIRCLLLIELLSCRVSTTHYGLRSLGLQGPRVLT